MKIDFIQYPYVFTDTGERITVDEICGVPRVGSELVVGVDGEYQIKAAINDSECVGGACPVK